jgi:hypothetical protein
LGKIISLRRLSENRRGRSRFKILNSIGESFDHLGILGIEVNWFGAAHPADHTFHNVDRYVRKFGSELYDVTMVRYAHCALPGNTTSIFQRKREAAVPCKKTVCIFGPCI